VTEVFPAVKADTPPAQPAPGEDLSAVAAGLQDQLAQVRAQAVGTSTVRLKVEDPHVAFALGHINVGADWTEVPVSSVPAIMEGAVNSGVTITQEEV
jgi:hypothetical protein